MRIERVLLENLGPIGHAELALGAVTAIVGTSGSGKTTALRAIQALLRNNRTGGKVLLRAGPIVLDRVGDQSSLTEGHDFSMLPAPAYLQPSPWALRQAAALNDGPTYLDEQGGMLASAVTRIILGAPETHAAIQSDLGRIVPRFRAVRSLPDGLQFTLRFDFDNAKNVLRRRQPRVTQHLLNRPQIGTAVEQVRRKTVPQRVRVQFRPTCPNAVLANRPARNAVHEARAAHAAKDWPVVHPHLAPQRHERVGRGLTTPATPASGSPPGGSAPAHRPRGTPDPAA